MNYKKELRDPLKGPFSSESIWNMPIGDEAVYVDAKNQLSKEE